MDTKALPKKLLGLWEEIIDQIHHLDFSLLKKKLADKEEGVGWDKETCDRVERDYKRFLILNAKYPEKSIVPTKEIDIFWHAHILDTKRYSIDCEKVLGEMLHHDPYLGVNGDEDKKKLDELFLQTKELWYQEFGHIMGSAGRSNCQSTCAGRCRS